MIYVQKKENELYYIKTISDNGKGRVVFSRRSKNYQKLVDMWKNAQLSKNGGNFNDF